MSRGGANPSTPGRHEGRAAGPGPLTRDQRYWARYSLGEALRRIERLKGLIELVDALPFAQPPEDLTEARAVISEALSLLKDATGLLRWILETPPGGVCDLAAFSSEYARLRARAAPLDTEAEDAERRLRSLAERLAATRAEPTSCQH